MNRYHCQILNDEYDIIAERIFEADSKKEARKLAENYANKNYNEEWIDIYVTEI